MRKKQSIDRVLCKMALGVLLMLVALAVPAWGQHLDWAKQAGGSGRDVGGGIAVDGEGSSYVTGVFNDTATFGLGESNETELTSFGAEDIFVAKYAGDGSLIWVRQAGGSGSDGGTEIAINGEGNSYVTGIFQGTATFGLGEGNETELTSFGLEDIFVAKYAVDGSLIWARQAGGSDSDEGNGIAVDGEGNSYVTGQFGDTATFGLGEGNETELTSFGAEDIFVAKYADDGSLILARQAGGSGFGTFEAGNGIAVDGEGNSYVTGRFSGMAIFGIGEGNEIELTSFGLEDIFVAKFASDGSLIWVRQAGGSGFGTGEGIAVDGEGNSYVTGLFSDTATFGAGEGNETELTSFGAEDIFVAKYADDGSLIWVRQAGGSGEGSIEAGEGIAVDGEGNSYVTGPFKGTATFGIGEGNETELTSFGLEDIFVAKYASDGSLIWVRQAGSLGGDVGFGIAIDEEGNNYVTGLFRVTAAFGVGEGNETELTSFGDGDIFVAKYAGTTIDSLIDLIEDLGLNQGIENSLLAKLRNAQKAAESSNAEKRRDATNILEAFINAVEGQGGKELTEEQADQLIGLAEQILAGLQ